MLCPNHHPILKASQVIFYTTSPASTHLALKPELTQPEGHLLGPLLSTCGLEPYLEHKKTWTMWAYRCKECGQKLGSAQTLGPDSELLVCLKNGKKDKDHPFSFECRSSRQGGGKLEPAYCPQIEQRGPDNFRGGTVAAAAEPGVCPVPPPPLPLVRTRLGCVDAAGWRGGLTHTPPRGYQVELFLGCVWHSAIAVMPTGTGAHTHGCQHVEGLAFGFRV